LARPATRRGQLALKEPARRELAGGLNGRKMRRQRRLRSLLLVLALAVTLAVGLSLRSGRLTPKAGGEMLAAPILRPLLGRGVEVGGKRGPLAWPAQGEGAVAVAGIGLMGASADQREVPIASLTKMMTAYVVLHDHPLSSTGRGPVLEMTKADVAAYEAAVQAGDSNLPVRAGEHLSERQLLEALLIPSADNIADLLGRWDAGSDAAFVAKMNATARALGLAHTHYADASGLDPRSRSSAADQARLAADVMGIPTIRAIVRNARMAFPVAGTITNYNPALGIDGIIGVKSGFTGQAQGCLAVAAWRQVGGRTVLVVAVSLGQADALAGAARADVALLDSASKELVSFAVAPASVPVASVQAPWARRQPPMSVSALASAKAIGWPGLVLRRRFEPVRSKASSIGRKELVGSLTLEAPWGPDGAAALVAASHLPPVPAGWTPRRS
jgi:D-alanyl-D-alanine carboxypeptidase (penicillin-binding protein 5/6)